MRKADLQGKLVRFVPYGGESVTMKEVHKVEFPWAHGVAEDGSARKVSLDTTKSIEFYSYSSTKSARVVVPEALVTALVVGLIVIFATADWSKVWR